MKVCENPKCGKVLVRKPKEAQMHWERRRTCDRLCGARAGGARSSAKRRRERAATTAVLEPRFCRFSECGECLVQHQNESFREFEGRKTCDRACSDAYMRETGGRHVVKSGKAPCTECADLSHRRAKNGCPKCGGQFREESAA